MVNKTWIDTKGVRHAYVKDAYESFKLAWARKQQATKVSSYYNKLDNLRAGYSWVKVQHGIKLVKVA